LKDVLQFVIIKFRGETMISARLPDELEQLLASASRAKHMSKSDMVKEALEQYLGQVIEYKDSFSIGEEYFGQYSSGDGYLSQNYKEKLRDKINAKIAGKGSGAK
jgi:predicted DNA-binding protein